MSKKVIKSIQPSLIDEAIACLKKKIYGLSIRLQQVEKDLNLYIHLLTLFSEIEQQKASFLLFLEPGIPSECLIRWQEFTLEEIKAISSDIFSWRIFETLLKQLNHFSEDAGKYIRPNFLLATVFSTGPPGKKHLLKIFVSLRRVLFWSDIL